MINTAFDKTVGWSRVMPLCKFPYRNDDLFTPAILQTADTGEDIPYRELKKMGFFNETLTFGSGQTLSAVVSFGQFCDERKVVSRFDDSDNNTDLCRDLLNVVRGIKPDQCTREIQEFYRRVYLEDQGPALGGGAIGASFCQKHMDLIS